MANLNENIVFSLNTSTPLLLLMLLGVFLKKKRIVNDEYISTTNKLLFYIAGPALIISNLLGADINTSFDMKLVLYTHLLLLVSFVFVWSISSFFIKDKLQLGGLVHGIYRSNFGYVGIPLLMLFFNNQVSAKAAVVQSFTMPFVNILAVILLAFCTNDKKSDFRGTLRYILLNPLIIAAVAAMILAVIPYKIPQFFIRTAYILAQLSFPLAIISIGASFNLESIKKTLKIAFIGSMVKLTVIPVIGVVGAIFFGIRGTDLAIVFLYGASPSAINSYIMTRDMGCDYEMGANIIMVSTLLSAFTIFTGMYFLKSNAFF